MLNVTNKTLGLQNKGKIWALNACWEMEVLTWLLYTTSEDSSGFSLGRTSMLAGKHYWEAYYIQWYSPMISEMDILSGFVKPSSWHIFFQRDSHLWVWSNLNLNLSVKIHVIFIYKKTIIRKIRKKKKKTNLNKYLNRECQTPNPWRPFGNNNLYNLFLWSPSPELYWLL